VGPTSKVELSGNRLAQPEPVTDPAELMRQFIEASR
jgi:hypothetical protein